MKRPEETNYPTTTKQLALSQQIISDQIDKGVWSFIDDNLVINTPLREWLKDWGWSITSYDGGFRNEETYFTLKPIGE